MNTLVVCTRCEKLNRVSIERASRSHAVCGSCKAELPFVDGVQELTGRTLQKLIRNADVPVVIDFWAEWCGPCKQFAQTFKSAAREFAGKLIFAKLDAEAHSSAAEAFQIRSIPTLMVFKEGMEMGRQSGALPLPMLKEYLNQWR